MLSWEGLAASPWVGVPGLREPFGICFGVCLAQLQTQLSLFSLIRIHFFSFHQFSVPLKSISRLYPYWSSGTVSDDQSGGVG